MKPARGLQKGQLRGVMVQLDPDLLASPVPAAAAAGAGRLLRAERIPTVRTLGKFLAEAQTAVRLKGEVSVLLTTDRAIRRLNRTFRGKNKATDVLSFPAEAGFVDADLAGDLAISVDTARKQAREQGHALARELKILLLHGLLHLAGYDHETDTGQMARRERTLRARLRLPVGLIERAGLPAQQAPAATRTARKKATAGATALKKKPRSARPGR